MKKVLIIQTAFIGDVILATSLVEKINQFFTSSKIDFLVRKGNESLLDEHPYLNKIIIWDKKKSKIFNLIKLIISIRKNKYDAVITCHRFLSSGLILFFSNAKYTAGFNKNPLSIFFTKKVMHEFNDLHEIERNHLLISDITDNLVALPKLYPSKNDYHAVSNYIVDNYVVIAPSSIWYTKQYPIKKWIELIDHLNEQTTVYIIGAPNDNAVGEQIVRGSKRQNISSLCGKLSLLQSAALMERSKMNYVNDSAPLHLCSAINAPVTVIYCSTIPKFGFGPLSSNKTIIETKENLNCRPCGIHGHKECPKKHFKCSSTINIDQFEVY